MKFEVKFIFLIKPFFLHDQKVVRKHKYLENISSLLKSFKSSKKYKIFYEGKSPTLKKEKWQLSSISLLF